MRSSEFFDNGASPVFRRLAMVKSKNPYSRDRYWRSLGMFADAFADVETGMHILLWERARIPHEVSQALCSGVRIKEAMNLVRRVGEVYPVSAEILADQEYIFAQLNVITKLRNDVLHYGSKPLKTGEFVVSNWITALGQERLRRTVLSSAVLLDLARDLRKIQIHLIERHLWREPGLGSPFPKGDLALLDAAWKYIPPPQAPNRRKTRGSAPKQ